MRKLKKAIICLGMLIAFLKPIKNDAFQGFIEIYGNNNNHELARGCVNETLIDKLSIDGTLDLFSKSDKFAEDYYYTELQLGKEINKDLSAVIQYRKDSGNKPLMCCGFQKQLPFGIVAGYLNSDMTKTIRLYNETELPKGCSIENFWEITLRTGYLGSIKLNKKLGKGFGAVLEYRDNSFANNFYNSIGLGIQKSF